MILQKGSQQSHQLSPRENKVIFLLLISFFLSVAYNVIPSGRNTFDLFLFSDQQLTIKTYVYFALQDVYKCVLMFCIYLLSRNYIIKSFFLLEVLLLLDYLLSYNAVILYVFGFGIGMIRFALVIKTYLFLKLAWEQSK